MGAAASAQNGFTGSKLLKSQLDTTIALFDGAVSVGLSIPNNKSPEQNTLEQVTKTIKDKKLERYFGELEKFVASGSKVTSEEADEVVDLAEPIGVGQAPVESYACFIPKLVRKEIISPYMDTGESKRKSFSGHACHYTEFDSAVMMADMSGFTALTERLQVKSNGAEALCEALNDFFSALLKVVETYGGDVVKFIGDAMQIYWPVVTDGTAGPKDLQEASYRAAVCSEKIHDQLNGYPKVHGVQLTMHMGLGAGHVTTLFVGGVFGRWENFCVGDPLRQIGIAEPLAGHGETVFSPAAWEYLKDHYEATPVKDAQYDDYMVQGAVKAGVAPPNLEVQAGAQLKQMQMHIGIAKYFIPNAIFKQLESGYASYLAEMRGLSVLFIKVIGLECDGPGCLELTHKMMQKVQQSIYKYVGSLNKLVLDDKGLILVAAFGLPPTAHADDPVRAIASAFEMRKQLEKLNIRISVGITTSSVFCGVVGSDARREYTVMGDGVNLSARLMAACKKDEVLVCENTAMACLDQVCFETLATIKVKGKVRNVKPFRPIGWYSGKQRKDQIDFLPTLVGRRKETFEVESALQQMKRVKRGLLLISGEHGIGKTCFAHGAITKTALNLGLTVLGSHLGTSHFLEMMPGRQGGNSEWEGTMKEIHAEDSFNAWEAVLLQAIGMFSHGGKQMRASFFNYETSAAKMRDKLTALLPEDMRPWVGLLKNLLPGLVLEESEKCEELQDVNKNELQMKLLCEILKDVSKDKPVLCMLDTCHTLDDTSWRLVEQVRTLSESESYTGAGISICMITRPLFNSFKDARYRRCLEQANEDHTHLDLGPLDHTANDSFMKFLYTCLDVSDDPLPESLVQYLWDKSQGNPFFVKEILANLQAEQCFFVMENQIVLNDAKPLHLQSLPPKLALIMNTVVDSLNAHEQMTMKIASVLGDVFSLSSLRAAFGAGGSGMSDEEWFKDTPQGQALEKLMREENLIEAVKPHQYKIKSPIMMEVCQGLLLSKQQKKIKATVKAMKKT